MTLPFDVFRVDGDGVRWVQAAATIEEAKAQISKAGTGAGEYLLLNQVTGNKIVVKVEPKDSAAQDLRPTGL